MSDLNKENKNIKLFIEKYGYEGFLKLFFTNYLFEVVKYYLHSQGDKDEDPSYLMNFNYKGAPYSEQEFEEFDKSLKKECQKHADILVNKLKKSGFKKIEAKFISDPQVISLLEVAFAEIIRGMK